MQKHIKVKAKFISLFKKMKYLFIFLPVFSYAQYFSVGLTDNSVPNEFKSVTGQFYEVGYSRVVNDWFSVNYGVRVNKAEFIGERNHDADYLSFLLNPKFRITDGGPISMIIGTGIRFGGNLNKLSQLNYLQANSFFQTGIAYSNFELLFAYDVSLGSAIYRGRYPLKIGSIGIYYYLNRPRFQ